MLSSKRLKTVLTIQNSLQLRIMVMRTIAALMRTFKGQKQEAGPTRRKKRKLAASLVVNSKEEAEAMMPATTKRSKNRRGNDC